MGTHAASSTSAQRNMTLTLTSPCRRSRKNQGHVHAIDKQRLFFCKQTVLNDVLFDATEGERACDRVDQSHSSISSHIPELCLSLTDSVDDVSYQQCKQKPCLCIRQKSLCKHYLLSAQYRFSICNKLFACLVYGGMLVCSSNPIPASWQSRDVWYCREN